MSPRIQFIDTARGIAILLVIVGHCISTPDNPLNRFILSFHMPLFFIISGMLMSSERPLQDSPVYLKDKAKRLLLPQLLLGIFFYLYTATKGFMQSHTFEFFTPIHLYAGIMNAWFLLVMFFITILAYIYRRWFMDYIVKQVLFNVFIVGVAVGIQSKPDHFSGAFAYINLVPMAWIFYILGHYSRGILISEPNKRTEFVSGLLLMLTFVVSQINNPVRMFAGDYGIIPLFLLTAVGASYSTIKLSHCIDLQTLNRGGNFSIAIYVYQFPVSMFFFDVTTKMLILLNVLNETLRIGLSILFTIPIVYLLTYFSTRSKLLKYIFAFK